MYIRKMTPEDIPCCAALAQRAYLSEKNVHPMLPDVSDSLFSPLLASMLQNGNAWIAQEDGQTVGYLSFTGAFEGAFGNCRGVFSPVHASAFFGAKPERTLTELISRAMEALCAQRVTSYAISRYAHEERTLRTLVLSGFGIRGCDLMTRPKPVSVDLPGFTLRSMSAKDVPHVLKLYRGLEAHMTHAPVCMKQNIWTEQDLFWRGRNVLVACTQGEPIACLTLEKDGETYLDELPNAIHIGRTYCRPEFRGRGVMAALVACAGDQAYRRGFDYLGVDCETLNPSAYGFWQKHFIPFTYSAVRRLDERLPFCPHIEC